MQEELRLQCTFYCEDLHRCSITFNGQCTRNNCQVYRLLKGISEIEYQVKELFLGVENKDRPYCEKILDIINRVKEGK